MELLSWNSEFIKTIPGMAMAIQAVGAAIGGLLNFFSTSILPTFPGLAFWSTVFISGSLTFCHLTNLAQSIEARFPYFTKLQFLYVVSWSILFLVLTIYYTLNFSIITLFNLLVLGAFLVDLFYKFRNWRSSRGDADASANGANAAEGGLYGSV